MVLRRLVSFLGEAYNHLSFGFERLRGCILNPLPSLMLRCIRFVERTRNPVKSLEEKLRMKFPDGDEEEEAYSLHMSKLSFFDPFESLDGVPVYSFSRASSASDPERAVRSGPSSSTNPISATPSSLRSRKRSAFMRTNHKDDPVITHCVFSLDGSRFAMCYASGDVIVWDTIHGKEVAKTTNPLRSEILAISFIRSSNSIIQIFTQGCKCYTWELEDNSLHEQDISYLWKESEQKDDRLELHTADFFHNGSIIVCSSIQKHPSMHKIEFVVATIDLSPELEAAIRVVTDVSSGSVVHRVEMSPDGKGLLAGISNDSLKNGYCFLWPLFRENSGYCALLDRGTLGRWSTNSDLVVTWIDPDGLKPQEDDRRCAFVWNVKELRNNVGRAHFAGDPEVLQSPFGDRVLWCNYVLDADGKDRLIMAIVGTTTRILFWDVYAKTHTRTIETGIAAEDWMVESAKELMESQVEKRSVRGMSSMALTMDRSKFGAVLGKPSRLLIWDAVLAVQSLKLSPQQSQANEFRGGADIIFSPTNGKIAMVGEHSAMVFAPPTPSTRQSKNNRNMETPMIEIDTSQRRGNLYTKQKLLFSGDGNTLGILPIGMNEMQVHNLSNNATYTIKTHPTIDGGIVDFSLSMDGAYIVANTARGIVYAWRCIGEDREHVGEIRKDLQTMALGITRDGKEIVVCSIKGELIWFTSDKKDKSDSNEGPVHENVVQRDDYRIPLLESEQESGRSSTTDSFSESHGELSSFSYIEAKKIDGLDVISCRISACCKKGVRLLKSKLLEVWNLAKRQRECTVPITIPLLSTSLTQDLLPLSGTQPSFDLANIKNQDLKGNGDPFLNRRRIIVPERDGFLVAADITSSTTNFEGIPFADGSRSVGQRMQRDLSSIFIISSLQHQRQLKGKDLHPNKGLAISASGRHVACISGKFRSKVTVWSVYACQGLLPDHHSLCLLYDIKDKSIIKEKCQRLLQSLGSNLYNFHHPNGRTLLIDGVMSLNKPLIRFILKHGTKNDIKVSLLFSTSGPNGCDSSTYHNAIEVSLHKRSPEIVKAIMSYLLERATHEAEFECILNHSFIDLHNIYPHIFQSLIKKAILFSIVYEIDVPESIFERRSFAESTSNSLNLSEKETKEFWTKALKEEFPDSTDYTVPTVPAKALTLPDKDACNIACKGLLHDLVTNRAHYHVFGSLVTRAIVNLKWRFVQYSLFCFRFVSRNYAKRIMIQEALYHLILLSSCTVYCFMLCTDGMYKIESHEGNEENAKSTKYSLFVCWAFAFPCFIRSIHQCFNYIWSYGMCGIFCWLSSAWNCMEAVSYFNLVIVLPTAEWYLLREGSRSTILSSIAAIESLLLWSRILYYARSTRRVGMFVTVISSVISAVIPFLFVVLCVVLGFAVAFHVLYRHVGHADGESQENEGIDYQSLNQSFGTFGRTLFTIFGFMFGQFDLKNIYQAPNGATAIILFVLYMVTAATTLLNMLIAVMNNEFSGIRDKERIRYVKARAAAIGDVESRMSYKMKQEIDGTIGSYLHVIIPKFGTDTITKNPRPTSAEAKEDIRRIVRSKVHKTLESITSRLITDHLIDTPLRASRISSWLAPQEGDRTTLQEMHDDRDDLSSEDESIHQFSDPESTPSH